MLINQPIKFIRQIEAAGLLGRGCGTYPTAKKWHSFLNSKAKEKYIICNVSESEPGIFKDKFIIEYYPEKVIDGLAFALRLFKATKAFLYLNPDYYQRFKNKLQILIDDDNIELFAKPTHDYIGGEESALINLMEGGREQPRLRPPYVTQQGLFGQPTLVNNCETFYDIALIQAGEYKGEKFFCLSGDNTPSMVLKLPEKLTVEQALEASGHYPTFPFFVQLGGAMSGLCLRADQLKHYTIQSYAGLVIHHLEKDPAVLIGRWLKFFSQESCGQCVPCREGTYRLYEMFQAGKFDPQLFKDIIFSLQHTTLCSLGKMATIAITSYYRHIKKIDF